MLNLRGVLATERDNIALKLGDWLKEDRALRRFNVISFDPDVSANSKAIQRHVQNIGVVGHIAAHKPDFEIANFTPVELAEIAAGLDEAHGFSGAALRNADWSNVTGAAVFEDQYKKLSLRKRGSLKGEEWGRALARHAAAYPTRSDTSQRRPLWNDLEATMRCRIAHYDIEAEYFGFDPNTFAHVRRKPYPPFIAGN